MNFFRKIRNWIEYGDAQPLKDFGRIFICDIGTEHFTAEAKFLKQGDIQILRLDLRRCWGSTGNRAVIDCYFKDLKEIRRPFQALMQDVQDGVSKAEDVKINLGIKILTSLAAGTIIRDYGRIDHHPKNDRRFHSNLYLSLQQKHTYWLILSLGKGTEEWSKWPVELAQSICSLLDREKVSGIQ